MSDTKLVLGPISFRDFEIPPKINFGGRQRLAEHKLIGAQRVVDALGPSPDPVKWDGRFRGPDATPRARGLEELRSSGATVPLYWGGFAFLVIVNHVELTYERFYEIPYKVTCTVVEDGMGAVGVIASSVGELLSVDMGAMYDLAGGLG